ncbi:type III pantothenate kinase [Pelagicoccus sp. NFK12]|uniref:Type III pantothenate kinase n=1 Tax=Pelagicoccus enzymogenes TaxID=2773457 RepID=A0A927F5I7_9BACT|nr:type III pantothenate kinase [Pelagicoccus enzymogenes]MBD5778264.1 type III pantothenate kinase [Pelagicoccus enzymogenes]MDQ8200932.1 type III pantothenate kinase [Pelagicoccus enzymogenes]
MNLCIDVGNTQMHGAVYDDGRFVTQFRKESAHSSRDEIGLFLVAVLREHGVDPSRIERIGISCVVPDEVHSLRNACRIYFALEPLFLEAGVKTRLKIKTRNPLEVGADRIANAIAVAEMYPEMNVVVVDFGTAITLDAVTAQREYLGGSICAGLGLAMEALGSKTAKLPFVEINAPKRALGRSTTEAIQSGLYFGYLGMIRHLVERIRQEAFGDEATRIVATGGFSQLYRDSGLFDEIVPDLVLRGVNAMLTWNPVEPEKEGAEA